MHAHNLEQRLRQTLREVADWPKKGVKFLDINPVLSDSDLVISLTQGMASLIHSNSWKPTHLAGIEARGFIFASLLLGPTQTGLIPVRKAGKLPPPTVFAGYECEYSTQVVEVSSGLPYLECHAVVVDDVVATGGTVRAAIDCLNQVGVNVVGVVSLISLDLGWSQALKGYPVKSLVQY
jgi:adenine phosphoribosyltransferase